jgi:hypothetical protein
MTGHPIPGDPSMMADFLWTAASFIAFFTSATSMPDMPLPILSCAVEKILSSSLYNINSPYTVGTNVTAPTGQTKSQTAQPSQAN